MFLLVPPAATANAGLLVPDATPVFINRGGVISAGTPADVLVGDSLAVWHDTEVVHWGAGQAGCLAPVGTDCYVAMQVLVYRPAP